MHAVFVKSAFRPSDLPETPFPHIAMLGRSNVGKSSLINHLAGVKNLARVSSTPGHTYCINLYEFEKRYLLVDLPGYGYSKAARSRGKGFEGMLGDYLSEAKKLRLVLLIVDARHGLMESDRYAIAQLQEQRLPFVIVANKMDKLSASASARMLQQLRTEHPGVPCIPHSTMNDAGFGELRDAIERAVRADETK